MAAELFGGMNIAKPIPTRARRQAMAMGERTPLASTNAPASGRMAVAEAITNIAAAPIEDLSKVRLSANWMAAAGR